MARMITIGLVRCGSKAVNFRWTICFRFNPERRHRSAIPASIGRCLKPDTAIRVEVTHRIAARREFINPLLEFTKAGIDLVLQAYWPSLDRLSNKDAGDAFP